MKLTIEINLDNAAFEDDPSETARILRHIATVVDGGLDEYAPGDRGKIGDINGNAVGFWKVTD